jgi:hypothetical protein
MTIERIDPLQSHDKMQQRSPSGASGGASCLRIPLPRQKFNLHSRWNIPMTLAQFAIATQADPKWVQNALVTLGLDLGYSEEQARRLGLARVLNSTLGMPLRQAWDVAEKALSHPEAQGWIAAESGDGSVQGVVDVDRYLSSFTAAASVARRHEPKARGRPTALRERSAVEDARGYGIDISLIRSSLARTVEERLRAADENAEFIRALRGRRGR